MNETKAHARVVRAIEDSFPIVEINRLAVPERNSFKPIYQMHKWFARRASCVFRAILLGCLKPLPLDETGKPVKSGAQLIMEEFYRDHRNDPDTLDQLVLDPFMGGGTTVVEALRMGCRVTGIDLNPVAWFVVKTEVEPVDLAALKEAFERLAGRSLPWSDKPLRETLLNVYRTSCPCCASAGNDANVIYTFWAKSAICTACQKQVPLFKDFVISQKTPSIRYWRDAHCPHCKRTFDWETDSAAMVAEPELRVSSTTYSAGAGRSTARWASSTGQTVDCPWCHEEITARPARAKQDRKKVPLSVLLCPHCEAVWQWRGELPDAVICPACQREYGPHSGNIPANGEFVCSCGHRDAIIRAIRHLPEDQLLPVYPYAIEGFCPVCAGVGPDEREPSSEMKDLFGESRRSGKRLRDRATHSCSIAKNGGKFFKRITPADLRQIEDAAQAWEQQRARLPHPGQLIPDGQETHRLLEHHYRYWHQMFLPRQLLCLATLLDGIRQETNRPLQELLLAAFSNTLEANNVFTRNIPSRTTPGGTAPAGVFARHDYQPKTTFCEQNVWGTVSGNNTFISRIEALHDGVAFAREFSDLRWNQTTQQFDRVQCGDKLRPGMSPILLADDSRQAVRAYGGGAGLVVTDPPYAGNVNYSELSDFFYVWLRLILADRHPAFAPDQTPKVAEIVENPARGLSGDDFEAGLQAVFATCAEEADEGVLFAFTFHHSEGAAWERLLRAVCSAGLEVIAVYPVHAEREASLHLMDKQAISYDLIHVCRKRDPAATRERRSWAGVRQEIRRRAREEIAAIQTGRYGNEPLSPADVNIVLIGKSLELYSRHYGAVVDHEGREVPLHEALKQIRDIADQMTEREQPLPSELEDLDPESRVYFRALCGREEVKSDDVHKATRGVLEPGDLMEAGLITKMRGGRGRSYEVKQPAERLRSLLERLHHDGPVPSPDLFGTVERAPEDRRTLFVDRVHLLVGLAGAGENLLPWLDRFRGETPQLRAALEYLEARNRRLAPACRKVLDLLEVGPLFKSEA